MRWSLRVSLVVVAGSFGCVGGPVSDWPSRGHDDGDGESDTPSGGPLTPRAPTSNGAAPMDAGAPPPSAPATDGEARDAGTDCSADAGACRASCTDAGPTIVVDPTATARLGCSADAPIGD